jgi:acetyl esterase/lipase
MLAPCLSLASEYRCPGGIDRVSTIAEAYRFTPASKCPGDPMADNAFLAATEGFDPIRRLERLSDEQVRSALNATRLMAIYESNDPRVPPAENILAFSQRLRQAGVPLRLTRMEADTHGSQELFVRYASQIIQFF